MNCLSQGGAVLCTPPGKDFTNMISDLKSTPFEGNLLAAGAGHHCSAGRDSKIYCWGENSYHQLEAPNNDGERKYESKYYVGNLPGVSTLAAGDYHTCVLSNYFGEGNEAVFCWGDNHRGQLGTPSDGEPVKALLLRSRRKFRGCLRMLFL